MCRGALRLPGGAKTVRGTANDAFGQSRLPGKGLKSLLYIVEMLNFVRFSFIPSFIDTTSCTFIYVEVYKQIFKVF